MNESRDDDELMLAFAAGESEAFDALYDRYRKPIYRYLFHAVGDRAVADDLYQDVWSRVIDARSRFRRGNGFRRWAFRIAHNRLVDHWRARSREPNADAAGPEALAGNAADAPDARTERTQQADRLRSALMRLPREQREAFLLKQEAGLTLQELAEREGVGAETIKSRLRYATVKLKKLLGPRPEVQGE
jgi:RNA polymerase sigma-70 factor (ECF subfamily)